MEITFNGEYILVEFSGENSREVSLDTLTRLAKACADKHCMKVLAIHESRDKSHTPYACVEKNRDTKQTNEFIETVLVNRSFKGVRLFADFSKAEE